MDGNPQQIVKMIRDILGNPGTEPGIRVQILDLARKNLHLQGVVEAVLEAVQQLKDSEARKQTWNFLMSLEDSRFQNAAAVYGKLIEVLKFEKDRVFRSSLLQRLIQGLPLNPAIAPMMIRIVMDPGVPEEERTQVMQALSKLPMISDDVAIIALDMAHHAGQSAQIWSVEMAVGVVNWSDRLIAKLTPFLEPQIPAPVRQKVWALLSEARRIGPSLTPLLVTVLHQEPDSQIRAQALEILAKVRNDDGAVFAQLVFTAHNDSDSTLRGRATALLQEHPEATENQVRAIAARLFEEPSAEGRQRLLETIQPWIRDSQVRTTIARAFADTRLSDLNDSEFSLMVNLLFPYVTREVSIRDSLLKAAEIERTVARRRQLIDRLIQTLKVDEVLEWVAARFRQERDPSLREVLFQKLSALSIAKHPALVQVFAEELTEPSSPFRIRCAAVLGPVLETEIAATLAFENVMSHDQDRELLRTVTEAYVRPSVQQKFRPLFEVIRNEALDLSTRRLALQRITEMNLPENELEELTQALHSSPLKP